VCLAAFLVNVSCLPKPSAVVLVPMPRKPATLPDASNWPHLSYDGTVTLPWCEYACRRFLAKGAALRGCRRVFLSYSLQQSLDESSGVACELH
jgi:hypothetical protein